jgi:hypothetical protein
MLIFALGFESFIKQTVEIRRAYCNFLLSFIQPAINGNLLRVVINKF